jgi:hypothetical protein
MYIKLGHIMKKSGGLNRLLTHRIRSVFQLTHISMHKQIRRFSVGGILKDVLKIYHQKEQLKNQLHTFYNSMVTL